MEIVKLRPASARSRRYAARSIRTKGRFFEFNRSADTMEKVVTVGARGDGRQNSTSTALGSTATGRRPEIGSTSLATRWLTAVNTAFHRLLLVTRAAPRMNSDVAGMNE